MLVPEILKEILKVVKLVSQKRVYQSVEKSATVPVPHIRKEIVEIAPEGVIPHMGGEETVEVVKLFFQGRVQRRSVEKNWR